MANDFLELLFPEQIAQHSRGGPKWATDISEADNGDEQRNKRWSRPREYWNAAYGVRRTEDLVALVDFHYVVNGMYAGFRFKSKYDFSATGAVIGTGDASETEFQLVKTYTRQDIFSVSQVFERKISKPVPSTVKIYLDGVEQATPGVWSVDYTTGLVTFVSAPALDDVITADFEFHLPMRFDTDLIDPELADYEAMAVTVPLVELKL